MVRVAERWVNGGRRGQHVARVAKGRQVAHVGHVGSHGTSSASEGQRLVVHALGELIEALGRPLVSLGLAGHLAVACLDAFFLHRQWSVDVVEFVVEATGVAHWISIAIASPQRGRSGLAVCTAGSGSSRCRQSAFGLDQGPVLSVHLVVEAAGVAEVVARSISPPERGGGRTTVHTLTALCAEFRAGPCLALAFGCEAGGRAAEQVWVKETGSVVVRRGERVGRVRGNRVVRGRRLWRAHGQAAPERAASLHLHTVTHLVLD